MDSAICPTSVKATGENVTGVGMSKLEARLQKRRLSFNDSTKSAGGNRNLKPRDSSFLCLERKRVNSSFVNNSTGSSRNLSLRFFRKVTSSFPLVRGSGHCTYLQYLEYEAMGSS